MNMASSLSFYNNETMKPDFKKMSVMNNNTLEFPNENHTVQLESDCSRVYSDANCLSSSNAVRFQDNIKKSSYLSPINVSNNSNKIQRSCKRLQNCAVPTNTSNIGITSQSNTNTVVLNKNALVIDENHYIPLEKSSSEVRDDDEENSIPGDQHIKRNLRSSKYADRKGQVHPYDIPVMNCCQIFMRIRKKIEMKHRRLFQILPEPPDGFDNFEILKHDYVLHGKDNSNLKRPVPNPPTKLPDVMKKLYLKHDSERWDLAVQHIVEKQKLVIWVEQETLREHCKVARAAANQSMPYSVCTILRDQEVYNVITPEQEAREEAERSATVNFNKRTFISNCKEIEKKFDFAKEQILRRQQLEATSLQAIQKFNWSIEMKKIGQNKNNEMFDVSDCYVPKIDVSDDFCQ